MEGQGEGGSVDQPPPHLAPPSRGRGIRLELVNPDPASVKAEISKSAEHIDLTR